MKPWMQVVANAEANAKMERTVVLLAWEKRLQTLSVEDRCLLSGQAKRFASIAEWCSKRLERME